MDLSSAVHFLFMFLSQEVFLYFFSQWFSWPNDCSETYCSISVYFGVFLNSSHIYSCHTIVIGILDICTHFLRLVSWLYKCCLLESAQYTIEQRAFASVEWTAVCVSVRSLVHVWCLLTGFSACTIYRWLKIRHWTRLRLSTADWLIFTVFQLPHQGRISWILIVRVIGYQDSWYPLVTS